MRFETINGTLCIMTEPRPLVPSIEYPYVIRGIKTKHTSIITKDMDALLLIFIRAYSDEFEVIGYPVADGSKEWALYQMMNGEKVCNPTLAAEKATRLGSYDVEQFNTFWYIVGDAVAEGKSNYGTLSVSSWIAAASSSGWKIYKEPKPESENIIHGHIPADMNLKYFHLYDEFKVGDWVKYDIDSYLQVIEPSGKERTLCRTLSGVIVYPYTSCLTKAPPSEVVVHIGCLSGTVEKSPFPKFEFILATEAGGCRILFDALDKETRELVEGLLKAQEEETNGK